MCVSGYLVLAIGIYHCFEGWPLVDCLYFAAVSLTSVGYGDVAPQRTTARLFLAGHIFVQLTFFVLAFGRFLDRFASTEMMKFQRQTRVVVKGRAASLVRIARDGRRRRFAFLLTMLCGWVGLGAVVGRFFLPIDSWADALYFGVETLTTMGFGDITPQTATAKVAVGLLCLVGVPGFGATLASLAKLLYESMRDSRVDCISHLTAKELDALQAFCRELEDAGGHSCARKGGALKISPFEYFCYVLMRSDIVMVKDIVGVMTNFHDLDASGDGFLEEEDLQSSGSDVEPEPAVA